MQHCEVAIVGGGPAGSACAWQLCRAGIDALVLDRCAFPRDKVCAGWITPQVVALLQIDLAEYARARTLQPITGFRTGVLGGREIETHYGKPVSYGIRRCEFDHYLLLRSTAPCRLGEAIKNLERTDDGWVINGTIRASMLVGAGGHFCPVARLLGARTQKKASVVAAQEIEFEADPQELNQGTIEPEMPELYFSKDLAGYGWCFRKGDYLNIGLGRVGGEKLSPHVARFCEFLRARKKIVCPLPTHFHGHAYQVYERIEPTLVADHVVLVGDAAGLACPKSGEGIRPAIESGLMAAEVVLAAGGDYRRKNLEAYRERILARFGKPCPRSSTDWLPATWLAALARRLLRSKSFTRRVVLERWFLHAHEPALVVSEPSRDLCLSPSQEIVR